MAKYPYYITVIEQDGKRDIHFVKVLSPESYIEMTDDYDNTGIWKHQATKFANTDARYKEKNKNGKLKLQRKYIEISENEWDHKFIKVVHRLAGGKKFKQVGNEEKIQETKNDLSNLFLSLEQSINSSAETIKAAQISMLNKYKSKILKK